MQKSSDLYNAIYDGVTKLKNDFEGENKIIIVLSAGKNLELSNYNSIGDIAIYARKSKVAIYSMQYMVYEHENIDLLANNTYGKFFHIQGKYRLKGNHDKSVAVDSLISFMNVAVDRLHGKDYKISYQSNYKSDGKLHSINLKTDDNTLNISFKAPDCNIICFVKQKPYISGGIALALLLLLLLFIRLIKKRKQNALLAQQEKDNRIQEMMELQEQELQIQKAKAINLEQKAQKEKIEREQKEKLIKQEEEKRIEKENYNNIIKEMKSLGRLPILRVVTGTTYFDWEINQPKISVGKNSNNSLVLNDPYVSGNHFIIFYKNKNYFIKDSNSTNGTSINGLKIEETKLSHNDAIQIGNIKILFIM
jgi:hypothetical protein